jgi:hypothetical protein
MNSFFFMSKLLSWFGPDSLPDSEYGCCCTTIVGDGKPEVLRAASNQYSQRSSRKYPEKITFLSQIAACHIFDCKRAASLLSLKCRGSMVHQQQQGQ